MIAQQWHTQSQHGQKTSQLGKQVICHFVVTLMFIGTLLWRAALVFVSRSLKQTPVKAIHSKSGLSGGVRDQPGVKGQVQLVGMNQADGVGEGLKFTR